MPNKTPLLKFIFDYSKLNCRVPRIPIRFLRNDGKSTPVIDAVLDSGADEVTIPKSLADWLQLSLKPKQNQINTASGKENAFIATVDFYIGRGGREVKYEKVQICVIDKCPAILIGINPVFDDYKITIIASEKKYAMEPTK